EGEIKQLITSIRSGQGISLAGGRKIGKTSILQRTLRVLSESAGEFYPLFLNCEPVMDYREFFRTVDMHWRQHGVYLPITEEASPSLFREAILQKSRALPDQRLILLMDEVDALLDFDTKNHEFLFKTFRALAQDGTCAFVFG